MNNFYKKLPLKIFTQIDKNYFLKGIGSYPFITYFIRSINKLEITRFLINLTVYFTKTRSKVPIIVTKSANKTWWDNLSILARCKNPGDLILHL